MNEVLCLSPGVDCGSRTMPHDDVAEQSVLGGMLPVEGCYCGRRESLRASTSINRRTRRFTRAILSPIGHGQPRGRDYGCRRAEAARRADSCGGAAYLHTLIASVPTAANAQYYAEIVKEHAIMRPPD